MQCDDPLSVNAQQTALLLVKKASAGLNTYTQRGKHGITKCSPFISYSKSIVTNVYSHVF